MPPEQLVELILPEIAAIVDSDDAQLRAALGAGDLPGDDVRVVLELRDQHLVTGAEAGARDPVRHEIDRLRGATNEHDFAGFSGADEARDLSADVFECPRGALRELVDPAVDVRIARFVEALHRVEHRARFLRARGAVEKHERLPVHGRGEDRKILARACGVESHEAVSFAPASRICSRRSSASPSQSAGDGRLASTSEAKPCTSSSRALASPIPRERR